jgi:hypothetical protein
MTHITEWHERVKSRINREHDVTALAAIAAIRSAEFDVFLAPETGGTIATVTCFYKNVQFIYKHVNACPLNEIKPHRVKTRMRL